jgi:hypothetical protein
MCFVIAFMLGCSLSLGVIYCATRFFDDEDDIQSSIKQINDIVNRIEKTLAPHRERVKLNSSL